MYLGLYTIILDFRGGTYVSQVEARDEVDAARRWASLFAIEKSLGRSSPYLAKAVLRDLDNGDHPTQLDGLTGVWCMTALCGGDLAIANIVGSGHEKLRAREREGLVVGELGDDVIADIQSAEYDASPR